ncbi:receptor-like protein 7 [Cynara cardunculus var. scolymus]|uniref:receptor-like protein 7 n=1 Tax=Cynara cardunculus var. scolymus TaxID=59895 RepID=UPI000D630B5E|nr:receptor-like protein 7 [Cynara cardunculus var. scolymus]
MSTLAILKRMNHPKLHSLSFFLFSFFICYAYSNITPKCSTIQSHALHLFKQNLFSNNHLYDKHEDDDYRCHDWLGSDYQPIMMNWNTSIDCCKWDGITCDRFTGDVIALDLSCGMLRGTIHPNSTLFNLPRLQRLNLAFNNLTNSQLPREIGRFSNSLTHLNISDCGFIGQVPTDVILLGKLVSLDLSWNDLKLEHHVFYNLLQNSTTLEELLLQKINITSYLPAYLNITSLKSLKLKSTGLQGKLPDNIFNLPYLEELNLAFNDLGTDRFPKVNTSMNSPLKWLDLSYTNLSGEIPDSISHLKSFNHLVLSRTYLSGKIPNSIGHLKSLNHLVLSHTNLSGEIPESIGHLKSLNLLDLSHTNLSGNIPDSIGHLKSLNRLSLSHTNLSGEIPDSIGHLESLNHLDLSYINFSEEIPESIGHLKSLNTLLLNSCGLMGPFPKIFFNLRNLTMLDLSSNMLNGTLPSSLSTLPFLEAIYLQRNIFSGSLPAELFAMQSLKRLSLGHNQFVGEIGMLDQGSTLQTFRQLVNLTRLDLSFNNFTGVWELNTLLSSLTSIEELDLSYSGLSVVTSNDTYYVNPNFSLLYLASCKLKTFPNSIGAMKNLERLDLSNNEISGQIPDWARVIGGNELVHLDLARNSITGLPQFQWNGLEYFGMQSNLIQGTFPTSICNMRNLEYLDMSNNSFSGVIPECLGKMITTLKMIHMGHNHFHGTIPNAYKDCGQLGGLILNGNQLEGEVPIWLSKCQSLKVLDLGNNHLNGTFLHWSSHLSHLQVLVLKSNKFHGPIESSSMIQHPFPSLKVLDLSENKFVGHLPGKYFQTFDAIKNVAKKGTKPEYLSLGGGKFYSIVVAVKGVQLSFPQFFVDYTIVDLSNNIFEGEIPNIIGSLNSLKVLNLSHNHLNGRIPNALGNLLEIESLDLSWNRLTGQIPQSLANITALAVLNLSHNQLVGRIPDGTQFRTFEATSFEGNPRLCGSPLSKHCEHLSAPHLEVDEDEESGFTWKAAMLGYGCGTILGLVLGYQMLSTGRPKWFNAIVDEVGHMIQMKAKQEKMRID